MGIIVVRGRKIMEEWGNLINWEVGFSMLMLGV
jgi:hypothetical protein